MKKTPIDDFLGRVSEEAASKMMEDKWFQSVIKKMITGEEKTKMLHELAAKIVNYPERVVTISQAAETLREMVEKPNLSDFVWSNEISGIFYVRKMSFPEKQGASIMANNGPSNMLTLDSMVEVADQMKDSNWIAILDYQATRIEEVAAVMKAMAIGARLAHYSVDEPEPIENAEVDWRKNIFNQANYFGVNPQQIGSMQANHMISGQQARVMMGSNPQPSFLPMTISVTPVDYDRLSGEIKKIVDESNLNKPRLDKSWGPENPNIDGHYDPFDPLGFKIP